MGTGSGCIEDRNVAGLPMRERKTQARSLHPHPLAQLSRTNLYSSKLRASQLYFAGLDKTDLEVECDRGDDGALMLTQTTRPLAVGAEEASLEPSVGSKRLLAAAFVGRASPLQPEAKRSLRLPLSERSPASSSEMGPNFSTSEKSPPLSSENSPPRDAVHSNASAGGSSAYVKMGKRVGASSNPVSASSNPVDRREALHAAARAARPQLASNREPANEACMHGGSQQHVAVRGAYDARLSANNSCKRTTTTAAASSPQRQLRQNTSAAAAATAVAASPRCVAASHCCVTASLSAADLGTSIVSPSADAAASSTSPSPLLAQFSLYSQKIASSGGGSAFFDASENGASTVKADAAASQLPPSTLAFSRLPASAFPALSSRSQPPLGQARHASSSADPNTCHADINAELVGRSGSFSGVSTDRRDATAMAASVVSTALATTLSTTRLRAHCARAVRHSGGDKEKEEEQGAKRGERTGAERGQEKGKRQQDDKGDDKANEGAEKKRAKLGKGETKGKSKRKPNSNEVAAGCLTPAADFRAEALGAAGELEGSGTRLGATAIKPAATKIKPADASVLAAKETTAAVLKTAAEAEEPAFMAASGGASSGQCSGAMEQGGSCEQGHCDGSGGGGDGSDGSDGHAEGGTEDAERCSSSGTSTNSNTDGGGGDDVDASADDVSIVDEGCCTEGSDHRGGINPLGEVQSDHFVKDGGRGPVYQGGELVSIGQNDESSERGSLHCARSSLRDERGFVNDGRDFLSKGHNYVGDSHHVRGGSDDNGEDCVGCECGGGGGGSDGDDGGSGNGGGGAGGDDGGGGAGGDDAAEDGVADVRVARRPITTDWTEWLLNTARALPALPSRSQLPAECEVVACKSWADARLRSLMREFSREDADRIAAAATGDDAIAPPHQVLLLLRHGRAVGYIYGKTVRLI